MPLQPRQPQPLERQALEVWRMMGRRMDWASLDIMTEVHDVDSVEDLIERLLAIRDFAERIAQWQG